MLHTVSGLQAPKRLFDYINIPYITHFFTIFLEVKTDLRLQGYHLAA